MTPDAWMTGERLSAMPVEPLLGRDYDADPEGVLARLRHTYGPVAPVDLLGVPVWLVIGYGEVLRVLQNEGDIWSKRPANWRARSEGRVPPGWPLAPIYESSGSVFEDGTRLSRLRDAWAAGLAPFQESARPQAQALERAITRHADDLIDLLADGGSGAGWADLSAQFARPLPLMVIERLLGLAGSQSDDVLMDVWRVVDAGPEAAAASQRLAAAMTELAAAKMRAPGDDLPSYMLAAVPDLTLEELTRELGLLPGLVGDFTGSLICNTIVEVLTDPGLWSATSRGSIEELVNRIALVRTPAAHLTFRFPLVDVQMGRFVIAAGDPVVPSIAGAHTDPLFAGAIDRNALRGTRAHLAWGAGPHRCSGRHLATRITTIAVGRLLDRFTRVRLALPADQLPWRSSPMLRGLRSLPVHFELAPRPLPPGALAPAASAADRPRPAADAAPAPEAPARSAFWRFLGGLRKDR
ncbi:cytochrome P450 [Sphaerisporangium melleum]|uniref:Cytochrome P450 n=1 Tax=Sphaerisporangium melleum TaxID=321316 RepID=A0A917R811_9ACTN|nr:cytochrome P450 [Sphaerisporangium melleum]GGK93909.1 cytochrome P450 [Sphaerisporangium melleum]GII73365.1 cytochrome P450 [Sphaerisporangium melleum]